MRYGYLLLTSLLLAACEPDAARVDTSSPSAAPAELAAPEQAARDADDAQ